MKRLHIALILPCVLFSVLAVAEQSLIKPQTQGEVAWRELVMETTETGMAAASE